MTPAVARWALALLVVVHTFVAWFPFRLDVPGYLSVDVEREASGALVLDGRRIVAEGRPPWTGTDLGTAEAVDVVLEVRPASALQHGPARILAVSGGYTDASLMIGQERDSLVVRVRHAGSDAGGNPPLLVHRAFARGGWVRVRLQVTDGRVTVAVDGLGHRAIAVDGVPMRTWDPDHPLRVGDERGGARAWNGEVRRAVVTADGHAVDYLAPGALAIADRAWYLPERLQQPLAPPDARARIRSTLHLVAFVPVGALVVAARRTPPGLAAVGAIAGAFALALQLGKIVLDARHPSVLTVLMQAAGALAGAWLLVRLGERRRG